MQDPFTVERRVQFRDTDAAGMMHFSTYFTYMEEVEHELLRSLGTSVVVSPGGGEQAEPGGVAGKISWPRVSATCDFLDAAHFEDMLRIEIHVARIGTSSVTYGFRFLVDEREVAKGSVTSVCCRFPPGGRPQSIPIPAELRAKLLQLQQPAGATGSG